MNEPPQERIVRYDSQRTGRQAAYDALIFKLLIVTITVPMYSVLCTMHSV